MGGRDLLLGLALFFLVLWLVMIFLVLRERVRRDKRHLDGTPN